MRTMIEENVAATRLAINKIGGEWSDLILDAPASDAEVRRVEKAIGRDLPGDLRRFALEVSRRVYFAWRLPENFSLPAKFREIFSGGIDFDLAALSSHEEGRAGWVRECFPDPSNEYDAVWHDKFAFHHVMNGDYIALDSSGVVVYLSHDGGEGNGVVMASSFSDLLQKWLPLGCPGPEDWQWLPFVDGPSSGLLPSGAAALKWRKLLGVART